MRSIPIGGNNFTETLVKAFKLPFAKRGPEAQRRDEQIRAADFPGDAGPCFRRSGRGDSAVGRGFMRRSTAIRAIKKIIALGGTFSCLGCRNIYSRTSRSMSSAGQSRRRRTG